MLNILDIDQSCLNILSVLYFLKEVLKIAYFVIPIGLIVMLSIDFVKGVINSVDGTSKVFSFVMHRIIYAMTIFIIPTMVFAIFDILGLASKDSKKCWTYAGEVSIREVKDVMETNKEELKKEIDRARDEIASGLNVKDKKSLRTIVAASENTNDDSESTGNVIGKKYHFTKSELKSLAYVAQCEQGSPKGAAAEATLMANRFELHGKKYKSLISYVRNSGWFAKSKTRIDNPGRVNKKVLKAVKDVLVNGNRTLPLYIDEHDYFGDISSIKTGSKTYTSSSDIKRRSNYKKNKTKVKNKMGGNYTFYCFPTKTSDPFGYTAGGKSKYDKANK